MQNGIALRAFGSLDNPEESIELFARIDGNDEGE
jgi:hypothetical protein